MLEDVHPQADPSKRLVSAALIEPELLSFILSQLPLGLCVFDGQDRLQFANQRYLDMWGLPARLGMPGTSFADIVANTPGAETARSRSQPQPLPGSAGMRRREWRLDNGRLIEVVVARLPDGSCVALHEDVTERRSAEDRIAHLALHDPLTTLPNRAHLREVLEHRLGTLPSSGELAFFCLDLDRFKPVNDTYGHPTGDLLLKAVADRLRQCVRGVDVVARLGGDEFALIQCGAEQPASATAMAKRLIDAVGQPFEVAGQTLHIGLSLGIAIAPFDGSDADTLQGRADLALYRAKADGRGTFRFYEPDLDHRAQNRRGLEADLRRAIELDQLQLAYQPQVDVHSNGVAGFEALLRWNHPRRGLVSPAEFIPLAEESGLILQIGRWALARACSDALAWPASLRVAVNVSPVQFRGGLLGRDVLAALRDSGLPPERLEIEITETAVLDDHGPAIATLRALKQQGVRVALDDFGTGYSSLSLLRSFPFDRLKIDRSFVHDLGCSDDALSIVRAVAGLGQSLGMAVTAEGVETPAQLATVCAAGCAEVQGFIYSRPVEADELAALIRRLGVADASVAPAPVEPVMAHHA